MRSPLLLALTLVGCNAIQSEPSLVDARADGPVAFEAMVDDLATADVVFLGELHDSTDTHELQLATTAALAARRPVVISLEMFERDSQNVVDLYLMGGIDEATFLEQSRPWPNYEPDYRGVIELARTHGLAVVAGNCYRPLASRVARQGLAASVGDAWAAQHVIAGPGPYRDLFYEAMGAMGGHGGGMDHGMLERVYQAQCIKDEAMAEGVVEALTEHPDALVVHWCGRFHSDFGLGTVERVLRRRPDADVRVVSAVRGSGTPSRVRPEDEGRGDYLWYVTN